ncbi:hypothetical protein [Nocardia mexicana]|uniref:Uncharacterized protein n=1 Tax=Nocardia mexicana TaxID=279262 RepID=A0A370H4V1_9NOCA|nr:hypothetical protein [Nocardia mexicana]RDI50798.1 hypothetical protein DFR68_105275 [Nocardia mexicana]
MLLETIVPIVAQQIGDLVRDALGRRREQAEARRGAHEDAEIAERAHVRALTAESVVLESRERRNRLIEAGPFIYDSDVVVHHIRQASKHAGTPILLFAPIGSTPGAGDTGPYDVGLRNTWNQLPWREDACAIGGAFKRPLDNHDIDLAVLRAAVQDLPIILLRGELQTADRFWISIVGWGIVGGNRDSGIEINLPPLAVPAAQPLEFQDWLARLCAILVGILAEWHALITSDRPPRIHTLVTPDEQPWVGPAVAAGYDIAAEQGLYTAETKQLRQSRILAESGRPDDAAARIDDETLRRLTESADFRPTLDDLHAVCELLEDETRVSAIRDAIDVITQRSFIAGDSPLRTW